MTDNAIVPVSAERVLDPLGDSDDLREQGTKHNRAKVGSARPSSLLYTYGPGAIMDLPNFTVMPSGLHDWNRIWQRRETAPSIHAPALLESVRTLLKHDVDELRPFPRQASTSMFSDEGKDLGVPARVFPQWLRCTGCDRLAPLDVFAYTNTNKYRPDEAKFEHDPCPGRRGGTDAKGRPSKGRRTAVTARYLLACVDGHLDEFPYDWWVHEGGSCPKAESPILKMIDHSGGRGASATIHCESCGAKRPMNQAQGEAGRAKLPRCRGRFPHLGGFTPGGCQQEPRLMLVGASNLWFPALVSAIDMPRQDPRQEFEDQAEAIRAVFNNDPDENPEDYRGNLKFLRSLLKGRVDVRERTDGELARLLELVISPVQLTEEEKQENFRTWDSTRLLVPEWCYLQQEPAADRHAHPSGLTLSGRKISSSMPPGLGRVLAVDQLRKVNALVGFTRVDDMDRVNDLGSRLVPITNERQPRWIAATEDRGEGIFLQLDEERVATWEAVVRQSPTWERHRQAHRRNFENRFSETAENVDPDLRLPPPRYWLVHTLTHVLFREMAMSSGYGAASISERIYAWEQEDGRDPAAGVLICTTASDSDGTLGGLVRLSEPELLADLMRKALRQAQRCSSDPICARRTPSPPEDFLHGAACHCCVMASETSCERANRFLDRRFLVPLPGADAGLAFFEGWDGGPR